MFSLASETAVFVPTSIDWRWIAAGALCLILGAVFLYFILSRSSR